MIDGVPVVRTAFERTVRLVSTARLRPPVLGRLVGAEGIDALAEIEGATSARPRAERSGHAEAPAREMIFGVPHAAFVNAAFANARPRGLNRFNGPTRGAWYAALDVAISLREVVFHMTAFLADAGRFTATVEYAELHASMAGHFLDLRSSHEHPSLHPDAAIGYPAGNMIADAVRRAGHNGIVYPSVRHAGGTCVVALWPHAVQSVARGDVHRIIWTGQPDPTIERVGDPV